MKWLQVSNTGWLDLQTGHAMWYNKNYDCFEYKTLPEGSYFIQSNFSIDVMRMLNIPDNYVFKPDFSGLPKELVDKFNNFMACKVKWN